MNIKETYLFLRSLENDSTMEINTRRTAKAKADGMVIAIKYLYPRLLEELDAESSCSPQANN